MVEDGVLEFLQVMDPLGIEYRHAVQAFQHDPLTHIGVLP